MQIELEPVTNGDQPDKREVSISGKATVIGVANLKKVLLEELEGADVVTIDVSGVTEADLTFFQLLCAAHRFAADREKKLGIAPSSLARHRQLALEVGYQAGPGCCWEQCSCLQQKED
ncbi:STAS domain-containing protein [Geomonas sp. Red32]|uniref:STAS domain-containing protein n=1 Tax=Geomonas sp. Red32 TaxID=2912856 RepID=UPI00202CEDCE|nr:STAS domain-containing protein [Geomonas sp. Red32]MCM0083185.1 STAS domain-containing protein [Geomonas sp. Red32]